jgi:hypothetical protein
MPCGVSAGDPGLFPAGLLLAAALLAAAAGAVAQKYRTDLKVRMTYQGSSGGAGASAGQAGLPQQQQQWPGAGDAGSSSSSGDNPKGTAPAAFLRRRAPGALSVEHHVQDGRRALGERCYAPALHLRRRQACSATGGLGGHGSLGHLEACRSWQRCCARLHIRPAMLSCSRLVGNL